MVCIEKCVNWCKKINSTYGSPNIKLRFDIRISNMNPCQIIPPIIAKIHKMKHLRSLSAVLKEFPAFSQKIEWKKSDEDEFCSNLRFGKVLHGVICGKDDQPIYDQPVIDFKECAMVIPYVKDENGKITKVFMIKSERPTSGAVFWEFPGGFFEQGETPEKGALRELQEETGITGEKAFFLGKINPERVLFNKAEVHVFAAESKELSEPKEEHNPNESKILERKFFSISEVKSFLSSKSDYCGITLAAWALFQAHFEKDF